MNGKIVPTTDETLYYKSNESTKKKRIHQIIFDLLAIAIIGVTFALVYYLLDPKISHFYCNDTDIFFPYIKDTIPFWALGIYGFLIPVFIILGVEIYNMRLYKTQYVKLRTPLKTFLIHLFHALSLFIMGAAVTILTTEVGKRWLGRLRPHFMAVCEPNYSKFNCTSNGLTGIVYNPIYTGGSFCTGDAKHVKEARYSCPSGHSSFSWYTMLFAIIYLQARLILLRTRYIRVLLQMACFLTAFVTMLSRVSDYHHRFSDVIAGMALGSVMALFITLVPGRVLFHYNRIIEYTDVDMKPN